LRGNAAIFERRQRIRDGVADLRSRMALACFFQGNLVGRVLDGLDHKHMAGQTQITGFRLDLRMHVGFRSVSGPRRFGDGVFHCRDHDSAVDRFFTRDRIGDLQKLEPVGADCHSSLSSFDGRPLRPVP
jgi:hypothetical protein